MKCVFCSPDNLQRFDLYESLTPDIFINYLKLLKLILTLSSENIINIFSNILNTYFSHCIKMNHLRYQKYKKANT